MFIALLIVHVIVAVSLVFIVLLQTGRGAELGAAFGGMGQATQGRGQSTFLSKATTVIAVVFMSTSLSLAFISTNRPTTSILTDVSSPIGNPAATSATTPKAVETTESTPVDPTAPSTEEQNAATTPVLPQSDAPVQPANPVKQ